MMKKTQVGENKTKDEPEVEKALGDKQVVQGWFVD